MTLSKAINNIVACKGLLASVVEAILNQLFSSGTQEKYTNHNFDLILWIYYKDEWREALLVHRMVERLITDKYEGNKAIRATCKADLK